MYRPQNAITLIIGTPKMVPIILGHYHMGGLRSTCPSKEARIKLEQILQLMDEILHDPINPNPLLCRGTGYCCGLGGAMQDFVHQQYGLIVLLTAVVCHTSIPLAIWPYISPLSLNLALPIPAQVDFLLLLQSRLRFTNGS